MRFLDVLWSAIEEAARAPAVPSRRIQVIGPTPDLTVCAPPRFAWDEKGWDQSRQGDEDHYAGEYRVYDYGLGRWRTFDGRLTERARTINAYVADPPIEIKRHPKGPCFMLVSSPWFRIHWHRQPGSVDEALIYVEHLLDECLNGGRH